MCGICKRFGGVQALDDVRLDSRAGEVVALVGENGAGKSTLVKILTGIYRPDAGRIEVDGQEQAFGNADSAARAGITAIHQEAVMFEDLTVAENIFIGRQPRTRFLNAIDWPRMRADAAASLSELGADIDPDAIVRRLAIAERHMVMIARAFAQQTKVIIFDEPTAALSQGEIQTLYGIIRKLRQAGKAIVFISHKFDEIFAVADTFTVLRDGRFVESGRIRDTSQAGLVRAMVGRPIAQMYPKAKVPLGAVVLEAKGLCHPMEFRDISFTLRRCEILGFYGLVGAGRTEVMEAIFGLKPLSAGEIAIEGKTAAIVDPTAAIAAGLAYVPEDRQAHGGILSMSICSNISLVSLDNLSRAAFLAPSREDALAKRFADRLGIRMEGTTQQLGNLSGGNQQKVIVAKWLAAEPKIIIFDEPTKGIDIGSKAAVHEFIADLVRNGLSVILVSSELDEVLGLADRIIVMHRGLVRGRLDGSTATRESVMRLASGAE